MKMPQWKWFTGIRRWWIRRRVNRAIRVLDALDWNMKEAGWTRTERGQFWNDYRKRHEVRDYVLRKLTQE